MQQTPHSQSHRPRQVSRRSAVGGTLALGVAGLAGIAAGCAPDSGVNVPTSTAPSRTTDPTRRAASGSVLLAYFSRSGENYYYGDRTELEIGNTEVLVGMIRSRLSCDVHKIEPADPYPFDYEETVERNRNEQRDDVRPIIANQLSSFGTHSIVLLASPVWNSSAPMIMHTFVESLDLAGVTIYPITTHAVSGLSGVPSVYEELCPDAIIGAGFTARGEAVAEAGGALDDWLRQVGLV
ncbi:hypothetical protein HND25_12650 [Rhodococcus erythropolis]|jgi:flavodoxin|uniref:Flavodoxin-like domain-containing protein n=1 Tax=Rhodococcus erythropolis TaxID=1833 RepID=A0A8I1D523_RHOER|nr:hypothetical protein [Rhodococcus erythropolis]MBO8146407.1 hypothetical protein [Rhodococcus erythropolis]MDO1489466.1 hypothetical protein [Rhodococcus erythropolis]